MKIFDDGHPRPIIAFDFDGTITTANVFPDIAPLRKYAKEVINFLYDIGVIVAIWTCRDKNQDGTINHQEDMIKFLKGNKIRWTTLNSVIEHAPFAYEARKIYAHMYVDDKGFGWVDKDTIMLDVLKSFLMDIIKCESGVAFNICTDIFSGKEVDPYDRSAVEKLLHRWGM